MYILVVFSRNTYRTSHNLAKDMTSEYTSPCLFTQFLASIVYLRMSDNVVH